MLVNVCVFEFVMMCCVCDGDVLDSVELLVVDGDVLSVMVLLWGIFMIVMLM